MEMLQQGGMIVPFEQFPIEAVVIRAIQGKPNQRCHKSTLMMTLVSICNHLGTLHAQNIGHTLPERHFSEIIDSREESIVVAAIEIIAGPWTPETVVQSTLTWLCSATNLSVRHILAVVRIFSLLPYDTYIMQLALTLTMTFLKCNPSPEDFAAHHVS
jgi:hypothetical protein